MYVYGGYYFILKSLSVCKRAQIKVREKWVFGGPLPIVSIIVAAYNEEEAIKQRIDNLLALDYPMKNTEIIVASDGSTDRTAKNTESYQNENVQVLEFKSRRGRAAVHNDAAAVATGQILVFTDAETKFDPKFLRNVVNYFLDASVGCVVGNLIYDKGGTAISRSEGVYWNFEKKIRKMESELGILATGSGACMAIRRDLWREVRQTDDIDFIAPLYVIQQGFRVVVANNALAYDFPPQSTESEFRARIRQTSKNFAGTLRLWTWHNWFKHPAVTWGLMSHKLLRWMTPYLLLILFISNLFIYNAHRFYTFFLVAQTLFYLLVPLKYFSEKRNIRIPLAEAVFSFFVANIGIAVGIFNAITGKIPTVYRNRNKGY